MSLFLLCLLVNTYFSGVRSVLCLPRALKAHTAFDPLPSQRGERHQSAGFAQDRQDTVGGILRWKESWLLFGFQFSSESKGGHLSVLYWDPPYPTQSTKELICI